MKISYDTLCLMASLGDVNACDLKPIYERCEDPINADRPPCSHQLYYNVDEDMYYIRSELPKEVAPSQEDKEFAQAVWDRINARKATIIGMPTVKP